MTDLFFNKTFQNQHRYRFSRLYKWLRLNLLDIQTDAHRLLVHIVLRNKLNLEVINKRISVVETWFAYINNRHNLVKKISKKGQNTRSVFCRTKFFNQLVSTSYNYYYNTLAELSFLSNNFNKYGWMTQLIWYIFNNIIIKYTQFKI